MKSVELGLPPSPDKHDLESLWHHLHAVLASAMQAMGGAGRTVCDFTEEVPWEFTLDMARQVWDESRHVEIFLKLLEHVEGYIGEWPESTILWRYTCAETPEEHAVRVNHGQEGLTCDIVVQLIVLAKRIGDPVIERALDFVLADQQSEMPVSIVKDEPYAVV